MRLAGILLACVGGAFIYEFTQKPTGGIPGFPQAWRGGPLLLGASFFGINGFYLILQKRFSLAALLVSGIVSAALTSVTHAYVRSIHETITSSTPVLFHGTKLPEFMAKSREMLPPEALRQFVEDARASGRLKSNLEFDRVFISFGSKKEDDEVKITVILNFEYCPYVHSIYDDSKLFAGYYSDFVHRFIKGMFTNSPLNPRSVADGKLPLANSLEPEACPELYSLVYRLVESDRKILLSKKHFNWDVYNRKKRDALVWLRDREPNFDIKRFLTDTLVEFDKTPAAEKSPY
jgi:hypothetical protein